MKIVIVNTADAGGGAERVASTLADGLRKKGHEVTFLCALAHHSTSRAILGKMDWVLGRSIKRIGYADAISLAAWRFLSYPEVSAADVIHFHNLHGFYFGMKMMPQIIAAKPCVWTMHDSWAISGGCYSLVDCQNWLKSCKPCPGHGTHPMTGLFDTASAMLQLKRRAFQAIVRHGGVVTGVSEWMTRRIHQAFEAANIDTGCIRCIPNFVDITNNMVVRTTLSTLLSSRRPIVLLVAANINNTNKGMSTALGSLYHNLDMDFTLVTVGSPFPETVLQQYNLADRTVQIGPIDDRAELAAIYRAAKVTLVPSLAESFSLVAAESIACGTPVVASDVTALPDLVRDGQTGFLAKVKDTDDFSRKVRMVLEMPPEDYGRLRRSTLALARQEFTSLHQWVDSYVSVYNSAISAHISN